MLYRNYLENLNALEDFQIRYNAALPHQGLEREDPDVRRLVEVMAFFHARIHTASLRNMEGTRIRLYRQFFSYLLSPIPAVGMVTANPTGQLSEVMELPKGTELALLPEWGGSIMLRTTRSLRVMPLRLNAIKLAPVSSYGCSLLVECVAPFAQNFDIGTLDLSINYLNDFSLSLKFFDFLRLHLDSINIQFNEYSNDKNGIGCPFQLGTEPYDPEDDDWDHPLEAERAYFHYPRQELYLRVTIPEQIRNWESFVLVFNFDQSWPKSFQVHRELFQLYTVPVVNSVREFSSPVICEGFNDRYALRHPRLEMGFSIQKIIGVYEASDSGLIPLRPGIITGGIGSYEVEFGDPREDGSYPVWLIPHFPDALQEPKTLVVDALWIQPWFDKVMQVAYKLQPFRRQTLGIKWELMDTPVPHFHNGNISRTEAFLHLFTLMHKSGFNLQDLTDLLNSFGCVSQGRFAGVFKGLNGLRLEELPGQQSALGQVVQMYHLRFKPVLKEQGHLLYAFVRHVQKILNAWSSSGAIEIRIEPFDENT